MPTKQSEVIDISISPMPIRQEKIAVKPVASLSSTLVSSKKPAVWSRGELRSQTHTMTETNALENSKASIIDMFRRKTVVKKPLHAPVNQNTKLPVDKKPLAMKKLDNISVIPTLSLPNIPRNILNK